MATARTNSKGQVTFKVRWPKDTKARVYRVKSSKRGSLPALVSASFSITALPKPSAATPAASVVATPSTTRPKKKSTVKVTVQVTPAKKSVTVRRQMLIKGKWKTLATARTNAKGQATFTYRWPKDTKTRAYRVTTKKRGSLPAMRTAHLHAQGSVGVAGPAGRPCCHSIQAGNARSMTQDGLVRPRTAGTWCQPGT